MGPWPVFHQNRHTMGTSWTFLWILNWNNIPTFILFHRQTKIEHRSSSDGNYRQPTKVWRGLWTMYARQSVTWSENEINNEHEQPYKESKQRRLLQRSPHEQQADFLPSIRYTVTMISSTSFSTFLIITSYRSEWLLEIRLDKTRHQVPLLLLLHADLAVPLIFCLWRYVRQFFRSHCGGRTWKCIAVELLLRPGTVRCIYICLVDKCNIRLHEDKCSRLGSSWRQ